jgi:glucose dehydrogenase
MSPSEPTYDAVVIGSGVCGALVAWQLALSGRSVLILEAGMATPDRSVLVGNLAASPGRALGATYSDPNNNVFAPTQDTSPDYYVFATPLHYKSTYARRVGGSTWHFLGNMPRFLPADFKLRTKYGVGADWPLTYDDLETHYSDAEHAIGVSGDHDLWNHKRWGPRSRPFPMSKIWESYSDRVLKSRLGDGFTIDNAEVRLMSTPQARNSRPFDGRPACAGNSSCVPLCPIQAKYDATVHVKKAKAAGAHLRDRSVVSRIEVDSTNTTIRRVHYHSWDQTEHTVRGRIVVLAAHAIESSRILLFSGLANSSDQVGRNLMDHLQGTVVAFAPEPIYPFRGPPTTSGVDAFRDGPFRRDHGAFRLSLGNDGWGRAEGVDQGLANLIDQERLHGEALRERVVSHFQSLVRFSYSTEMLPKPDNRIELDDGGATDAFGIPRPKFSFSIDDYSRNAFTKAQDVCKKIFTALGATGAEYKPPPQEPGVPDSDLYASAGHISGTCRMGDDPKTSVVDKDCRSHDHRNLFIVGSSVFPTEGTANPTLTAAAVSMRSVRAMKDTLEELGG